MRKHTEQIFGEFERVIDQFFDELLLGLILVIHDRSRGLSC